MSSVTERVKLEQLVAQAQEAKASRIIIVENRNGPHSSFFLINGKVAAKEAPAITMKDIGGWQPDSAVVLPGIGTLIHREASNGGVFEIVIDSRSEEQLKQELIYKETFCKIFVDTLGRSKGGLFLLGGPSSSGRSSALLDVIAWVDEQQCHQLVLGRPLDSRIAEVKSRKGVVIGRNVEKVHLALETIYGAQVVVIDQLSREDYDLALDCADRGTIVIAVMSSSTSTVNLIESIPEKFRHDRKNYIREQLARTLRFAATHSLVRSKNGLVMAEEVLVVTPAIRNLIRENKEYRVTSAIQTGHKFGMLLRDERLKQLLANNTLTTEEACAAADHPEEFIGGKAS